MRGSLFAALLGLALCVFPASAQEEPGVFGVAPVADRTPASRGPALPIALAAALQRLSPQDDPASRIDLHMAMIEDETLLQRFEYEQVTRATASGIPSIRTMLKAWFRSVPARELLVRAGIPVWRGGGVAPTLWLIEDDGEQRRLLGANATGVSELGERLDARGIRLRWPLQDLDDLHMLDALTPDTVAEELVLAARRSAADAAVLAWMQPGEATTRIDWYMAGDSEDRVHFTTSGADPAQALDQAAGPLLAALADRHAVQPSALASATADVERGPGEYVVWLEQLDRAGTYAQAVDLLMSQPVVAALAPEQADGHRVRVRIQIEAPLGQLLAMLAADGRLEVAPAHDETADLALRWRE